MNTLRLPHNRREFHKAIDFCSIVIAFLMLIGLVATEYFKQVKMEETTPTTNKVESKLDLDNDLFLIAGILLGFMLCVFILSSIHVVEPSRRKILTGLQGGAIILENGIHFYFWPLWRNYGAGPFKGLGDPNSCPTQNTRVLIDPAPAQIHTSQRVQCDIDIQAEARILQWGKEILCETGKFKDLAATRINDWVSRTLSKIDTDSITYNNVSKILNEPGEIEKLNVGLLPFYIAVDRISLDPNGIKMSRAYMAKREEINTKMQILDAKERELKRELEISELEHKTKMKFQMFENERMKAIKDAEIQIARSQQETLQIHIHDLMENCKLQPEQVIPLVIAEIGAKSIRETPNISKMVVIPSSNIGYLNGNTFLNNP